MSSEIDNCPKCGLDFNNDDIYQHFLNKYNKYGGDQYTRTVDEILKSAAQYPDQYFPLPDFSTMTQNEIDAWNSARMYGWTFENPKCFRKEIGIEIQGYYDGIALWKCPDCGYIWKRFEWVDDKYLNEES